MCPGTVVDNRTVMSSRRRGCSQRSSASPSRHWERPPILLGRDTCVRGDTERCVHARGLGSCVRPSSGRGALGGPSVCLATGRAGREGNYGGRDGRQPLNCCGSWWGYTC